MVHVLTVLWRSRLAVAVEMADMQEVLALLFWEALQWHSAAQVRALRQDAGR